MEDKTMNYAEAVKLAVKGKNIQRLGWRKNSYLKVINKPIYDNGMTIENLILVRIPGESPMQLRLDDFLRDDWVVCEEHTEKENE